MIVSSNFNCCRKIQKWTDMSQWRLLWLWAENTYLVISLEVHFIMKMKRKKKEKTNEK